MKAGPLISLGASVVLGGAALVVGRGWIGTNAEATSIPPAAAAAEIETIPVVVASTDIETGAEVDASSLTLVDWPANLAPRGALSDPEDVRGDAGDTVYAAGLIAEGEPVLLSKVAFSPPRLALAQDIQPGKRAVSIEVDDVRGVAGFILPGDRVDVVEYTEIRDPNAPPWERDAPSHGASRMVLRDVLVLAVDQAFGAGHEGAKIANTVTLEVSRDQALALNTAANRGDLALALIGEDEEAAPPPPPPQPAAPPAPRKIVRAPRPAAPKPPSSVTIRVISGSTEQSVQTPYAKDKPQ